MDIRLMKVYAPKRLVDHGFLGCGCCGRVRDIDKGELGGHFKMARIRNLRHIQLMQLVASTVTLDWYCGHASEQCDGSEEESVHG